MPPASAFARADVVLVGGGLANGLIALRLRTMRPNLRVILLERERRLAGEQTWRWFESDVSPGIAAWLRPLIVHRWSGWEIRLPGFARYLATPVFALTAERLRRAVTAALGPDVWLSVQVTEIAPNQVALADGRRIAADTVIDGRGARRTRSLTLAWRVFLAQEVTLRAPHGLTHPILIDSPETDDATCPAFGAMPLDARRLRLEVAQYAGAPTPDLALSRAAIAAHAAVRGWAVEQVHREEDGALPIVLAGDIDAYWREARPEVAKVGLRAANLHPGVGHTLPDAARLADQIAALPRITSASVRACAEAHAKTNWRRRRFHRLLNRLLLHACPPEARNRVWDRFHRLAPGLIQRYLAARPTLMDKARILLVPAPIPLPRVLEQVSGRAARGARDASGDA
jgi:lycopene beta-cyclase